MTNCSNVEFSDSTCGLAEEIDQEKASAKTTVTSSCGSVSIVWYNILNKGV